MELFYIHKEKPKTTPCHKLYTKITKQVKNPQVIAKSVRLLEENIGGDL